MVGSGVLLPDLYFESLAHWASGEKRVEQPSAVSLTQSRDLKVCQAPERRAMGPEQLAGHLDTGLNLVGLKWVDCRGVCDVKRSENNQCNKDMNHQWDATDYHYYWQTVIKDNSLI